MKKPINGSITISRLIRGDDESVISLRIDHPDTRLPIIHAEIKLADFAECLTGRGHTPCAIDVRSLLIAGNQKEETL